MDEINYQIETLHSNKEKWSNCNSEDRLKLLENCLKICKDKTVIAEFEAAAKNRRDYQTFGHPQGDLVIRQISTYTLVSYLSYLRDIFLLRNPRHPVTLKDNIAKIDVTPGDLISQIVGGFNKLYLHLDKNIGCFRDFVVHQPRWKFCQVAAVLAASNNDSPVDVLTSLFIDNRVCLYKLDKMSEPLLTHYKIMFGPLIEYGVLDICVGGADVGKYIVEHQLVEYWYLTGSKSTATEILYGKPVITRGQSDIKNGIGRELQVRKPFTAELGGCSPWIIMPQTYTKGEMKSQIAQLASALIFNGGHVCVHPQVIITQKKWKQRDEFITNLRRTLASVKFIGCFYKNTKEKMSAIEEKCEKVMNDHKIKIEAEKSTYSAEIIDFMIFAVDSPKDFILIKEESFCPACCEAALDGEGLDDFSQKAIEFCNDNIYGSLCATIIYRIDTKSDRNRLDKMVEDLKYGIIGINGWGVLAYIYPQLGWGSYPQYSPFNRDELIEFVPEDYETGVGCIGNCYRYEGLLKSIVEMPFRGYHHLLQNLPENVNEYETKIDIMGEMTQAIAERVVNKNAICKLFSHSKIVMKLLPKLMAVVRRA